MWTQFSRCECIWMFCPQIKPDDYMVGWVFFFCFSWRGEVAFFKLQKAFHEYMSTVQVQHWKAIGFNSAFTRRFHTSPLGPGLAISAPSHSRVEELWWVPDCEPFLDHLHPLVCQSKWPALLAQQHARCDAWLLGAGRLAAALRRGGYITAIDVGRPIFPHSAWIRVKEKYCF